MCNATHSSAFSPPPKGEGPGVRLPLMHLAVVSRAIYRYRGVLPAQNSLLPSPEGRGAGGEAAVSARCCCVKSNIPVPRASRPHKTAFSPPAVSARCCCVKSNIPVPRASRPHKTAFSPLPKGEGPGVRSTPPARYSVTAVPQVLSHFRRYRIDLV